MQFVLFNCFYFKSFNEFGIDIITISFSNGYNGSLFYFGYVNEEFDWDFLFINTIVKHFKYNRRK